MLSSGEPGVLSFRSCGFELYLPPTPFKSRFVMLNDSTQIFYDVDYETSLLGNKSAWSDLAPETLKDPAIVFPPEQRDYAKSGEFAIGFLVSILRREVGRTVAKKLGRVNVKPFEKRLMNWSALKATKGEELPNEMQAGLLRNLWNKRTASLHSIPYVTESSVLDAMPRKWHLDGAALNYELDSIFAGGAWLDDSHIWEVHEVEATLIDKYEGPAKQMILFPSV